MFDWFRGTLRIPNGILVLNSPPVDGDGKPAWTKEIAERTSKAGNEFLLPFMHEVDTGAGNYIGGYLAKGQFTTSIRSYEARATSIQRKNDEYAIRVFITAPGKTREQIGDMPWLPYCRYFDADVSKSHALNLVTEIKKLCQQAHDEELHIRSHVKEEMRREGSLGDLFLQMLDEQSDEEHGTPDPADDLVKDTTTHAFVRDVVEESRRQPVVVYFWAPWCGPCGQLTSALEKVFRAIEGKAKLVKMNIDEHPAIPNQMGIKSIPAVIGFINGEPIDGFLGAFPENQIADFVERLARR